MLRLRPHKPFPTRGQPPYGDRDEAGYYKGKYVRREEYDDGFAEIDGTVVETSGEAELRVRYFRPTVVLVAPALSMVGAMANDPDRKRLVEHLEALHAVEREAVAEIGRMERPWWMSIND